MSAAASIDAGWARPEALAPLLAPGLSAATASRLLASVRVAPRLPVLVSGLLGNPAAACAALPAAEARLAMAPAAALRQAATLAGAVWHGGRVRALVLAQDVAAFVAAHGAAARAAAFAHHRATPSDARTLDAAIVDDGTMLLEGWRRALPAPLPDWIALRLAPPTAEDAALLAAGPELVRAIAAEATG